MIIVDTGFWVALINQQDTFHSLATNKLIELTEKNERFITTCAVMTETSHLLLSRLGQHAQMLFMQNYQAHSFEVFELKAIHAARIRELMQKYSNLPMDLADATLVVLAEQLGHGRILSTDFHDFGIYRWNKIYPFINLMQS